MNLCLIYLTAWVTERLAYEQWPQRWIMGADDTVGAQQLVQDITEASERAMNAQMNWWATP